MRAQALMERSRVPDPDEPMESSPSPFFSFSSLPVSENSRHFPGPSWATDNRDALVPSLSSLLSPLFDRRTARGGVFPSLLHLGERSPDAAPPPFPFFPPSRTVALDRCSLLTVLRLRSEIGPPFLFFLPSSYRQAAKGNPLLTPALTSH